MHNKSTLIVFLLVMVGLRANSQSLSHQVLVPAANVLYVSGINYSQTIGETAVEIGTSYDRTLTQGFQQPGITFNDTTPPPGAGVEVYPNPVTDYVKVEMFGESSRDFTITIVNINGSTVYSDQINFSDEYWYVDVISFEGFIRGVYFLRVLSKDGIINRTFKLEKI